MKIAIVGLGLMGGSIAKATVRYAGHSVLGFDKDGDTMQKALKSNCVASVLDKRNICDADMVIFALTPALAIDEMNKICPLLKEGAIVTDICGVKRCVASAMANLKLQYPHLHFIGAHPMAGKERGGFDNADENLFKGAYVVATPVTDDKYALGTITEFYKSLGAKGVTVCTPEEHDVMISYTSQMAHIVSSCYVQNALSSKHVGYSAGSYDDLTRVARLNPEMWTELFLKNADNLCDCIADITSRLNDLRCALEGGDADKIKEILSYGLKCKENSEYEDEMADKEVKSE